VGQCDVSDFTLLASFREKRTEWLSWYSFQPDDPNNIERQIIGMVFNDLSYRMLARARGDLGLGPEIAARSGLLAHLLDEGYMATQVLSIRRLLDDRKDVYSVRRLFDNIFESSALITRENFVAYDGTPYEPSGWQSLPPSPESQIWGIDAPSFAHFLRSFHRHKMFDKLSGVAESKRTRRDTIRPKVFERLLSLLNSPAALKLVKFSHKFLAHASDAAFRQGMKHTGVLLKDIEAVQKAIISVERAITDDILYIGIAREVVPMTPLGFLKGLDKMYVPSEEITKMDAHWDELKEDRDKWKHSYEKTLYKP
jgi:hypothetical protein